MEMGTSFTLIILEPCSIRFTSSSSCTPGRKTDSEMVTERTTSGKLDERKKTGRGRRGKGG